MYVFLFFDRSSRFGPSARRRRAKIFFKNLTSRASIRPDPNLPPEVFSLSEVVLAAHVALARRLRETSPEQERTCRLLRSFVPGIVREDAAGNVDQTRRATGALLFADASGFTALTQSSAARNPNGRFGGVPLRRTLFESLAPLVASNSFPAVSWDRPV